MTQNCKTPDAAFKAVSVMVGEEAETISPQTPQITFSGKILFLPKYII